MNGFLRARKRGFSPIFFPSLLLLRRRVRRIHDLELGFRDFLPGKLLDHPAPLRDLCGGVKDLLDLGKMRRKGKIVAGFWLKRHPFFWMMLVVALLYVLLLSCELPLVLARIFEPVSGAGGDGSGYGSRWSLGEVVHRKLHRLDSEEEVLLRGAPVRPDKVSFPMAPLIPPSSSDHGAGTGRRSASVSQFMIFEEINKSGGAFSELHKAASHAWKTGIQLFRDLNSGKLASALAASMEERNRTEESCPHSITLSGDEFRERGRVLVIPCGLTIGSHITLVGKPSQAHPEFDPKISMPIVGDQAVMVSQFMIELQGLKTVDGEDPPRILHFNPRLKGDWSGIPVIEQNTCYRMQWGTPHRCEGWKSRADEETVDGLVKCEKWIRDDDDHSEESKTTWWLNRLIGRTKKVSIEWPYPFAEEKLFVLTLSAGLEGYHINVDGKHITSFPYRTGFVLEDATGFSLNGDLEVKSVFALSLPTSHPSFAPQRQLEMSSIWKAPSLPNHPVELFIGILSAGNHFAERMAVRKSWMQSVRRSKNIVARFFVALHGRKEVNVELMKEAEFFGDIVMVPFMDSYDLVVLKTLAICEYGIHAAAAKYIMKCDDDTFVRVDSVLRVIREVPKGQSLYVGNINYHHKPLREGKWAVTYEEWPEEDYPPYANGPGYIISSDIARFIYSEFKRHSLRLFKMEDVSMGMWVELFNITKSVTYVHDVKFCQFGCIDNYFTAHYQSPRQMLCMWEKLEAGWAHCCNMR